MRGAGKAYRTHGHHSDHTLLPARGPSGEDGQLIKQPVYNRYCQLILRKNCPVSGGQAPPPAIPASLSPSKPVQPQMVQNHSAWSDCNIPVRENQDVLCRFRELKKSICLQIIQIQDKLYSQDACIMIHRNHFASKEKI